MALLPLLCVALGGGTARWSQGIILAAIGLLLLIAPPRLSLGPKLNLVLAGLAALAFAAYLPARWLSCPSWRSTLVHDFGLDLPSTVTPQPWLTAEGIVLFLAGLGWFYLMATVDWRSGERAAAARIFSAGAIVLAVAFLVLLKLGIQVPIWPTERHFGPFPNRNQTADFLAVSALPVLACMQMAWRAGRRGQALGWLSGWLALSVAEFTSFSRAGVILLFFGALVYLIAQAAQGKGRAKRSQVKAPAPLPGWRRLAIAASLLLLLLSAFIFSGGETLERLTPASATSTAAAVTSEFRLRIQKDALDMIAASPWCGIGLGNFASVFPIFRASSALPKRAIHPESDWLWMAAELGWPALILAAAGLLSLLPGIWPLRRSHNRLWRTAAASGLLVFVIHAFVDVSAHRLGTVLSALFVMSLALGSEKDGMAGFRVPARWPGPVFRALGAALVAVGVAWVAEAWGGWLLPGEQGVVLIQARTDNAARRGDYAALEREMNLALAWAPLRWNLYFGRALVRAFLGRADDAAADFRRSYVLEPFLGNLPADEARIWLATGHEDLAVEALVEAARREPARAEEFMGQAHTIAPQNAVFEKLMWEVASNHPALMLPFLNELQPPQNAAFIAQCLSADPDLAKLSAAQRAGFCRLWAARGDPSVLAQEMARHPAWQKTAWRWWAEACGRLGAYEQACGIIAKFAPAPLLPVMGAERMTREELMREADVESINPLLALRLYAATRKAGDLHACLDALRRMTAQAGAPLYFRYLEAVTAAEAGDWRASWDAWQVYLRAIKAQE